MTFTLVIILVIVLAIVFAASYKRKKNVGDDRGTTQASQKRPPEKDPTKR
ncbi:FeoB-associated Cys-rich membrane protein [Cesiribacter sp. SM1]|nr:FeoB-associated Cys-rich membrane protein [Cesiribacter sp. SM1]